jgi:hypothetical protein
MGMATAFPSIVDSDPSVCKVYIDNGQSMTVIYTWMNPATNLWESRVGYAKYNGPVMLPITFPGDELGKITIDLTDMTAT